MSKRNRERLIGIARAVYEANWIRRTARALGYRSNSSVQLWAKGTHEPSDEHVERMVGIARAKIREIERAINEK